MSHLFTDDPFNYLVDFLRKSPTNSPGRGGTVDWSRQRSLELRLFFGLRADANCGQR
jgi:hypothetical protein